MNTLEQLPVASIVIGWAFVVAIGLFGLVCGVGLRIGPRREITLRRALSLVGLALLPLALVTWGADCMFPSTRTEVLVFNSGSWHFKYDLGNGDRSGMIYTLTDGAGRSFDTRSESVYDSIAFERPYVCKVREYALSLPGISPGLLSCAPR